MLFAMQYWYRLCHISDFHISSLIIALVFSTKDFSDSTILICTYLTFKINFTLSSTFYTYPYINPQHTLGKPVRIVFSCCQYRDMQSAYQTGKNTRQKKKGKEKQINRQIIPHNIFIEYKNYFKTLFPNRGFPRLLSWLIVAKYQTEIKIGRINLWRLSFEDVLIKKSGLSIVSCWFLFLQCRYRYIYLRSQCAKKII